LHFFTIFIYYSLEILEKYNFLAGNSNSHRKCFSRHEFFKKSRMTIAKNLQNLWKMCKVEFQYLCCFNTQSINSINIFLYFSPNNESSLIFKTKFGPSVGHPCQSITNKCITQKHKLLFEKQFSMQNWNEIMNAIANWKILWFFQK
jgi:hypothetical protein